MTSDDQVPDRKPVADGAGADGATLYVVATPIGNRGDLSPRALEVLRTVAVIAAEDTRHSGQFLRLMGVGTRLLSLHEHNEAARSAELIDLLRKGESVALVSDAGTPLISDPGFDIVREARQQGIRVVPIPGSCALIAALSVAGLPTDRFSFEGFLPQKAAARRARLDALRSDARTLVFYESPYRLRETLADIIASLGGERQVCIARELTKLHETVYFGTASMLAARARDDADMSRGELVIVVSGQAEEVPVVAEDVQRILGILLAELPAAQAAKLAARITGVARKDLYELATGLDVRKSQP